MRFCEVNNNKLPINRQNEPNERERKMKKTDG